MYREECIAYIGSFDWEEWDGKSNFILGFALAERSSGNNDYVVVKMLDDGSVVVAKEFSKGLGSVNKLSNIYSALKREKTREELSFDVTPFVDEIPGETKPKVFSIDDLTSVQACREYLRAMGREDLIKENKTKKELLNAIKKIY